MLSPKEILQHYWGYADFKPPQLSIIETVLANKDTLAILPTGGGKSLCYQVPAVIFEHITLVISPLIALMQDQVQHLNRIGIGAASITSQLNQDEIISIFDRCKAGKIKLLYVAPERLQSRSFIQSLMELKLNLIAIDEAHCIAQWGHDFRPAYLKISSIKESFPTTPFLALTATAMPKVQQEIIHSLGMKDPAIFQTSLKRDNLVFKVVHTENELDDLVYHLKKNPGVGIVFVRTRKKSYAVAQFLSEKGFNADFFHARLPNEEKTEKQEYWTLSEDQIMVSTNAFGMGIDKSNVRTVIHLDLPNNLEAYVQEAGRAGRDGKKAEAILFLDNQAVDEAEKIFRSNLPNKEEFRKITKMFYNYFNIGEFERPEHHLSFDRPAFLRQFGLNAKKAEKILGFLNRQEVIRIEENRNYSSVRLFVNPKYNLQTTSIQFQVLETLARRYAGILSLDKAINEYKIAQELKQPVKVIYAVLYELADLGYLHYKSRDVKNVYFLRPRETDRLDHTLWKAFEALQIQQWKRLQDMIYYASQQTICREKLMLRYFGEKPKKKCGKCDVCASPRLELQTQMVLEFLNDSPKTIQEITEHFIQFPKITVLKTLEHLSDENLIESVQIDAFVVKK